MITDVCYTGADCPALSATWSTMMATMDIVHLI